ncbi:unnamed protein product [Rhizoctonia solani]|uniref:Uncharacterized protein n=1 Tax=Rhizoctonia solani TaxID=456999 RepID=A0A8H3HDN5_9AGAM|nr:unnamed protein product [Rhizoctonia solani]CAE7172626.1 unnamed protein product [Rhizoctonia solani]
MGCLPSRHQINNFKEERRRSMVERRMSRRLSDNNGFLAPPPRIEEENQSGRTTPHATWTEDDTYIPRFDSTLPRLR